MKRSLQPPHKSVQINPGLDELLAYIEDLEDTISVLKAQIEELQGDDDAAPFDEVKAELGIE